MPSEGSAKNIELQSNEVEDMLGRVPGWITRNGILLFAFLIVLLIFGSWVFKYPDVKRARIVVTSVNPPANLEARTSGKIVRLFVVDNQVVETGEVLAMIENPANFDDVMQLKSSLSYLDSIDMINISEDLPELKNAQLGAIQGDYSVFLKVYRDFKEFNRINYHRRRIRTARTELEKQQDYTRSLSDRATIQEEAYNLSLRQFNRDATLYEEGVISPSDLEESRSKMLIERNKQQEIISQMAENNVNIARTEDQIVDLELKQLEALSGNVTAMEESYNNLKAGITSWEQNYLLVAPLSGAVTFTRFWSENQNVKEGEKVLTIIPAESGSMLGKILLPLEGAGKVRPDMQVNIQFDNYPHLEYGMVEGKVINKSQVSEDNYYTVEVELPDGLFTYYGIEIPFTQNMQGQAEILTDKKRLLERVLNPIKSAITKQVKM